MSAPPPSYGQSTTPETGGYYPPPPEPRESRIYQPPVLSSQNSYPPPPASSPGIGRQLSNQYYPPPPASPPASQSAFLPPPPAQSSSNGSRMSYQTPHLNSSFQTVPASAPPTQTQFRFNTEKNPSPPPSGGEIGSHASYTQPLLFAEEALDDNDPKNMPGGAPAAAHFSGATSAQDDVGTFNGGSFRISHRDTNTILTMQLAMGCPLIAKPGVMIAMSTTVTLKGTVKFSMKKLIAGGEMAHSTYTGPGELLFAPPTLGDITTLRLTGKDTWNVGRDSFMVATQGVVKEYKRQGLGKAMFSGEGLFVYKMSGIGLLWISSFGAIIRKDLQEGERYIIDNGHLVAWNCTYVLERVASGGLISGLASGEGLVCKFSGPGTVFLQTRNPAAFSVYLQTHATAI
ncbi:hypothetical protein MMC19_001150 [Ptychographa xylographoides]|nr:hypothetical protein [Ptychographa xylographoides]